jgi:RimJ/RimL family protein N-acetyltransferase
MTEVTDIRIYPPMSFSLQTERLELNPWAEFDFEAYSALIAARGEGVPSPESVRLKMAAQHAQAIQNGISLLAIRHRGRGSFVGYCGLIVGRSTLSEPEIAYELLPNMRGFGYATEAALAVVAAARATGRNRLWATIRAWNTPSFRVAEKLGFHRRHSTTDDKGEVVWMSRRLN